MCTKFCFSVAILKASESELAVFTALLGKRKVSTHIRAVVTEQSAQLDDGEEELKDTKVNINFCSPEFSFLLLPKETKTDAACISNQGGSKIETLKPFIL